MILFLQLGLFTACLIMGVHAVTRPDKLLSFLGVYISEEYEKNQIKKKIAPDLLKIQDSFFMDLSMIENSEKLSRLSLLDEYKIARRSLGSFDQRMKQLSDIIEIKQNKWHWKLIRPFAPMLTECIVCMSSFWSCVVMSLHFSGALYFTVLNVPVVLCLLMPFIVAGIIYTVSSIFRNDLSGIEDSINNLSNG